MQLKLEVGRLLEQQDLVSEDDGLLHEVLLDE